MELELELKATPMPKIKITGMDLFKYGKNLSGPKAVTFITREVMSPNNIPKTVFELRQKVEAAYYNNLINEKDVTVIKNIFGLKKL